MVMGFAKQSLTVVWFLTELFPKWRGVRYGPEALLGWYDKG